MSSEPLETGHIIDGKYRLVRLIGNGGMGSVYEGENLLIRRRVAIKILHAGSTGNVDAIRRFEREAQAAGEIGNDHILEVLDLGSLPNGDRYMVMEYLDGETLAARIERYGRLAPEQISLIAMQFLTALASAHAAGIIHRDLKPENIFILRAKAGRADFVKLIDFGISKFSRPFNEGEHRMTRADAVLGTPCYMSPEQARGARETDVRSDIYSCGVILFESVTGKLPFEGESFNDLMFKIALSDAPSPLSFVPSLDPEFAWIINRAIARDPDARFATARDFADAIDAWMRKNAVGEGPSMLRTSDVFPAGSVPSTAKSSPTVDIDADVDISQLQKTGTDGSWAHSHSELLGARRRRAPKVAAVSVAGLAVVGTIIALMMRADPSPAVIHPTAESPGSAAGATRLPAPPTESPLPSSHAGEDGAPASPAESASAAGSSLAQKHDPSPRPAHPAAPSTDKPKPKAAATSKAFDLGY